MKECRTVCYNAMPIVLGVGDGGGFGIPEGVLR